MPLTEASLAPLLAPRNLVEHHTGGPNAHQRWYKARDHIDGPIVGPIRLMFNYVVLVACKHSPSLTLKRWILRGLGVRLGPRVTIASGVMFDFFFPELIEIGEDTILGMDTMVLTHEFLHDRFRVGRVYLGPRCLVGARSTVLAGVTIAEGTTVAAMSLVNKGIRRGAFVGGVPVRLIGD